MGFPAQAKISDKAEHAINLPESRELHMTMVGVTPEIASAWLGRNRGNRAVAHKVVKQYQTDMERGQWSETCEPIKFSKTGRLMDGQHRLHALINSGVKLRFVVVVGVQDEAFADMDTGKVRSAGNVLSTEGLGDWQSRVGATAAHWILGHIAGRPLYSNVKSTNHAVRTFLLDNPKYIKSIELVEKLPRLHPPISHSLAVALHWVFRDKDAELAEKFMEGLFIGESLRRDSPVLMLRNKMKDSRLLTRNAHTASPFSTKAQMHACIKAWNLMRKGRFCTSARNLFPRSDEDFPEVE